MSECWFSNKTKVLEFFSFYVFFLYEESSMVPGMKFTGCNRVSGESHVPPSNRWPSWPLGIGSWHPYTWEGSLQTSTINTEKWLGLLAPGSFAMTPLLILRPTKKHGGKREQSRGEKAPPRRKGVVALPKPSAAKVTFGREKNERGQTVPARSCCTSAQTVGKMTGLNKNASDNKKEIFPEVFLAWRMNCLRRWPPCLSQWGQETDCHSYNYD